MIHECYISVVMKFTHNTVIVSHLRKEQTLTGTDTSYFWPTMDVDIDTLVAMCLKCP